MGGTLSAAIYDPTKPWPHKMEIDHRSPPTFDPMLGFPNGRKEREMPLTYEQIADAQVPLEFRDYCVHKYLEIEKCMRGNSMARNAWMRPCAHLEHEYHDCMNEDNIIRFKEYERERRLRERQKRRIEAGLETGTAAA